MTKSNLSLRAVIIAASLISAHQQFAFADLGNQEIGDDLNQIEMKVFQREFPNDSTEIRLSRIEQAVCGQTESGPNDERLSHLLTVIPNLGDDGGQADGQSNLAQGDSGQQPGQQPDQQYTQQQDQDDNATATDYVPASEEYPAINQLERELLGTTYVQDPVATRLSRLEQRAFGRTSNSQDLADRTDRLKKYAQRAGVATPELAQDLSGGNVTPPPDPNGSYVAEPYQNQQFASRPYVNQPYLSQSMRAQNFPRAPYQFAPQALLQRQMPQGQFSNSSGPPVAWQPAPPSIQTQLSLLEQRIFGKIYNSEPIPKRLKRLDKAVFPKQPINTFTPISARINQLNNSVFPQPAFACSANSNLSSVPANTSQPTGTQTQQSQQQQTNNNGHPILRSLGRMIVPALEEGGSMLGGGFGI